MALIILLNYCRLNKYFCLYCLCCIFLECVVLGDAGGLLRNAVCAYISSLNLNSINSVNSLFFHKKYVFYKIS